MYTSSLAKITNQQMQSIHLQKLMIIKFMFQKYMEIVCLEKERIVLMNKYFISDSDVELAPSDNPTTSTYFRSILR